jgi:hypothetical protein
LEYFAAGAQNGPVTETFHRNGDRFSRVAAFAWIFEECIMIPASDEGFELAMAKIRPLF